MTDTNIFLSTRPAYPWSVYPLGLPALAVVAVVLVLLTLWTYLSHPQATRKRVFTVLVLRLLALLVALLTAVRPSVGIQEDPKIPSVLLIGVDLSESMTVRDEVNNQARIDAVRKVLEKAQPILDELAADQNVTVVMYPFGPTDFSPDAVRFDPKAPADGKRSDYGVYLSRTYERWQGERFMRGHLLIGDGVDNGTAFSAIAEAGRWGKRGCPITTFTVGTDNVKGTARDIAVVALSCDPSPVPIKTDVTITARVHAYGLAGSKVLARVFFNDKEERTEEVTLTKEKDNEVKITTKAPDKYGEVKVRLQIGRDAGDGKLEPLPGEVSGLNNESETYLTVTKEGVRILIIDRQRHEETFIKRSLAAEKRFDVNEVIRQTTLPATREERQFLDLDNQAYDVIIIGNISYDQLVSADPTLPAKIIDRVTNKGMGLMFLGGEAAYTNYPPSSGPADPSLTFTNLLPIQPFPGQIIENVNPTTRQPVKTYQTVPTAKGIDGHVMTVDRDPDQARALWDRLNAARRPRARISGLNRFTPKGSAIVYARATNTDLVVPAGSPEADDPKIGGDPLLVGQQLGGTGSNGRVLAFAAYDTILWLSHGQPKTNEGVEIFNRFWKQCVLWLAHQEEEEGQVYVRPEFRRLPIGGDQTIRVGLKAPSGGDDPTAELEVKLLPPGKSGPEDEEKAPRLSGMVPDPKGGRKVRFNPPVAGEYTAVVTSPMKDKDGKPVIGPDGKPQKYRGTARFLAFPEVSDEMLNVAADHKFLEKLAGASGGKALRLEDLPGFLRELKTQPLDTIKPKPRYLPDWRRNHSKGFLPAWLALFTALLGLEWGLRRMWGMV